MGTETYTAFERIHNVSFGIKNNLQCGDGKMPTRANSSSNSFTAIKT